MRLIRSVLAICVFLLFGASLSHAGTISGSVYCDMPALNTPDPGSTYAGTLCATFEAGSINFASDGGGGRDTLGWFLDTGSTLPGSVTYLNGYTASSNFDNTLFTFTGQAFFANGAQYTVTHDDGTVMQVNGMTVFSSPSPTPPITDMFTYTGVTGTYDFAFNYTQDGGGAVYYTNAADSPVPESGSLILVLIGTGVVGTSGAIRYRLEHKPAGQEDVPPSAT